MADLDRAEIVELLGRLDAEDNEAVLSAARELARKLSASGLRWDDVVRASLVGAAGAGEPGKPASVASAAMWRSRRPFGAAAGAAAPCRLGRLSPRAVEPR